MLVEGVVRLPFATPESTVRQQLVRLANTVFRTYPALKGTLFETFNWVTETELATDIVGYRVVYGLDYLDFESDRSRTVQERLTVTCPGDVANFSSVSRDEAALAFALERTYDEGSNVRVNHVVNRLLVIRGLVSDSQAGEQGRIVSL